MRRGERALSTGRELFEAIALQIQVRAEKIVSVIRQSNNLANAPITKLPNRTFCELRKKAGWNQL